MQEQSNSNWIDISVPLFTGMVHWPGDPEVQVTQKQIDVEGTVVHLTSINMSAHTGTHMDAPLHFVNGGMSMDAWTPETTIGLVRVITIEDRTAIHAAELEQHAIKRGERILFRTANSESNWVGEPFKKRFIYIARDAAEYLTALGVRTIGVDYLSIGGYVHDLVATHVALLTAGIWVIEGLNLSEISAGSYEMVCLPLRLKAADGAPARVLLRRLP